MKSLYEILKIKKTATSNEIKSAYKKLSKQYHPDLNPNNKNATENFKTIDEAYKTLSDIKKRAEYDKNGVINTERSDEEKVKNAMLNLFLEMLTQTDLDKVNIFKKMTQGIKDGTIEMQAQIEKLQDENSRLKIFINKCKDSENFFIKLCKNEIKQNKKSIENIKEKYNRQNLALKFIEKNKFELEIPKPNNLTETIAMTSITIDNPFDRTIII